MKVIKYILFLFIILLISCKSTKPSVDLVSESSSNPSSVDTTVVDYDADGVVDQLDAEPIITSAPPPETLNEVPDLYKGVKGDIPKVNNCSGTVTTQLPRSKGLIAYSVPTEMQVGKEYSVKVRISKKNDRTTLIVGDREIPISDDTTSVKVELISVSPIMSANLLSQKGNFEITSLSTEVQNIDEEGYTEWAWAVTPLVGGQNNLKLNIKIRIKENGETCYKDITVFEKKIKVKSNIGFSIKEFFLKNWEWFMGAILIPIIQWLWVLWKKRKEEKEKDVS